MPPVTPAHIRHTSRALSNLDDLTPALHRVLPRSITAEMYLWQQEGERWAWKSKKKKGLRWRERPFGHTHTHTIKLSEVLGLLMSVQGKLPVGPLCIGVCVQFRKHMCVVMCSLYAPVIRLTPTRRTNPTHASFSSLQQCSYVTSSVNTAQNRGSRWFDNQRVCRTETSVRTFVFTVVKNSLYVTADVTFFHLGPCLIRISAAAVCGRTLGTDTERAFLLFLSVYFRSDNIM